MKFIILSKMACDILSIPIIVVASKSTFSASNRVIDTYRAFLEVDTIQFFLLRGDWLHASFGIKS